MQFTTFRASLFAAAMALAFTAQASESDTFCDLAQARAEASSAVLSAPEAFGSVGDPVTASRAVTMGLRKSTARSRRAELTDQMAQAECAAFRADRRLQEQISGIEARAELLSLIHTETRLRDASALAYRNLDIERRLLEAHNARLSDVKTAFEQVDTLDREIAAAASRRARIQNQLPDSEVALEALVQDSINAQAQAADISAKLVQASSWDITYGAGVRADLNGRGGQDAFIAVTATWSLGKARSDAAASRVAGLTAQLLNEQRDGAMQSYLRAKDTVRGLIEAERMTQGSLLRRQALLEGTVARVQDVKTMDGERLHRTAEVDLATTQAALAGSSARLTFLTDWLARQEQPAPEAAEPKDTINFVSQSQTGEW